MQSNLSALRKRLGGALIGGVLNSATRLMRYHPRAWKIGQGIKVHRNVPYVDAGQRSHWLNIYQPMDALGARPVLLYIHGGGFRILSKDTHWMMNYLFARAGYVVFSINYRLVPEGQYPVALQDVCQAVQWIQTHGKDFGADLNRWVVAGESAGANLSLALTIATCGPRPEPWAAQIFEHAPNIEAVLPACGILEVSNYGRFKERRPDLKTLLADRIEMVCREYLGSDDNAGTLADPLQILESDWIPEKPLPPMMAIVGTADPILDDTRRLGRALNRRKVKNEIKIYPGGIHAFHAAYWTETGRQAWADQFSFLEDVMSLRGKEDYDEA